MSQSSYRDGFWLGQRKSAGRHARLWWGNQPKPESWECGERSRRTLGWGITPGEFADAPEGNRCNWAISDYVREWAVAAARSSEFAVTTRP
jgi:hypothetical protein